MRMTGDQNHDIFGFQTASIQATLQLLRITVCSTDGNTVHDVRRKCDVAEQVLNTFTTISPQYLRAISTPLVYHLGAIGTVLGSAMEGILTEESYQRVRGLLEQMANLLSNLESGLQPTAGASKMIRDKVIQCDQYMQTQRQMIGTWSQQDAQMGGGINNMGPNTAMLSAPGQPPRTGYTPMDEFQLPADIVNEFPWPFDYPNFPMQGQGYQ